MQLKVKRVYEPPSRIDGKRVLVDRLWPRGLARKEARIDLWLKEVAPSDTLRKWFGHDPSRWGEFKRRYSQELKERGEAAEAIRLMARGEVVTLLYGARDQEHNNAVALKEFVEGGRINDR